MQTLNIIFQVLGALVVMWMLSVALVALFNVVGNTLLSLAETLGVFVEKASLGTIKVINTAGVYDRPVVIAEGGVRKPAQQPKQQPPKDAPQAQKPANAQPQSGQSQEKPAQPKPAEVQPQHHQQQQTKPVNGDGEKWQKVWHRIQQLENELRSVRNSSGGSDDQTGKALQAILDKLDNIDERLSELENNQDAYMEMYTEIDARVQALTQGELC